MKSGAGAGAGREEAQNTWPRNPNPPRRRHPPAHPQHNTPPSLTPSPPSLPSAQPPALQLFCHPPRRPRAHRVRHRRPLRRRPDPGPSPVLGGCAAHPGGHPLPGRPLGHRPTLCRAPQPRLAAAAHRVPGVCPGGPPAGRPLQRGRLPLVRRGRGPGAAPVRHHLPARCVRAWGRVGGRRVWVGGKRVGRGRRGRSARELGPGGGIWGRAAHCGAATGHAPRNPAHPTLTAPPVSRSTRSPAVQRAR